MAAGRLAREVPAHHEERGVSRPSDHISGITSRPVVVCSRNPTGFFEQSMAELCVGAKAARPRVENHLISDMGREPGSLIVRRVTSLTPLAPVVIYK